MKVARPKPERIEQIYDYLNWLDEQLDKLDDNYDMDAETFISQLRSRTKAIDHKIRHVLTVCDALIENLCDLESDVLQTRPDIIKYLQAEER